MERIHYAGGELITGEAIARAVLEYAKALAKNETSDEVEIPIRREDGSLGAAQLLLGPASQLVAETIATDLGEIIDDALVERLRRNAARLADPRPVIDDSPSASTVDFEMTDAIESANGDRRNPRP